MRELVAKDVEEHELLGREKFRWCEVGSERDGRVDLAKERRGGEEGVEEVGASLARRREARAELEVASDERVADGLVQLGVVASRVNSYDTLMRLVVNRRVAHNIVREVVLRRPKRSALGAPLLRERTSTHQYFHGEEEARFWDHPLPVKDAPSQHLDLVGVTLALRRPLERSLAVSSSCPALLQTLQPLTNLDNAIPSALVDLGLLVGDVVEDVAHEGTVSGSNLVDDEVLVGVEVELVLGDEEARDGSTVPRLLEGKGISEAPSERGRRGNGP
jgi:hypothetical protein